MLNVRQFLGFVGFGVFCAFPVFMLLCSLIQVFSVTRIEASVHAEQNVNVKRHLSVIAPYFGGM